MSEGVFLAHTQLRSDMQFSCSRSKGTLGEMGIGKQSHLSIDATWHHILTFDF